MGLVLIAAACSSGGGDDKAATTSSSATLPPPVAPLTGVADPSGVAQGRAAVMIKLGNTPAARPQSGIAVADVVYEEVVEGGITRLLVVFNSETPDPVGKPSIVGLPLARIGRSNVCSRRPLQINS